MDAKFNFMGLLAAIGGGVVIGLVSYCLRQSGKSRD